MITTAAGYTKRRKTDSGDTDAAGYRNLAEAARDAGVRRFVFTGILRSDVARDVPHFWNKTLAERDLADLGVPYVSLRPGAFFDMMDILPGGGPRRGWLMNVVPSDVRQGYVLSADVAKALVALVDATVPDGTHIDLTWDRPVGARELAALTSDALGRRVRLITLPQALIRGIGGLFARRNDQVADMLAMFRFFATGAYVGDTTMAAQLFGGVRTPEEAIRRWAASPPLARDR